MTNSQIIETERALHGITCEVHTFAAWKQMGYVVKKGEKAAICTQLWKKVKKKAKEEGEDPEEKFVLVKSYLFTENQVEPIAKKSA